MKKNEENLNELNDFKPRKWLVILLIIIALAIVVVLITKGITVYQEKIKDINSLNSSHREQMKEKYDEINNQINEEKREIELESFNSQFELHTGTQIGNSVSWLLDSVITNNKKNQDHLIEVEFQTHNTTNTDEITNIKKELDDWQKYEVSLDYDEEGYANKIIIKE